MKILLNKQPLILSTQPCTLIKSYRDILINILVKKNKPIPLD